MTQDEEYATIGRILTEHQEAKRTLVCLEFKASRHADQLQAVVDVLRSGGQSDYSIQMLSSDDVFGVLDSTREARNRVEYLAAQRDRLGF